MTGPITDTPTNAAMAIARTIALVVFALFGSTSGISAQGAGARCALIFSTNDTHGRLLPEVQSWSEGRLVGGSATLAAYATREQAEHEDCPMFLVSGGDFMQGTLISNLTNGRATVEAMNAMGYVVASIGNHEFDWGIEVLRERIADADFALLGANIYLKGTEDHPAWARPWTIVEKEGVRVGFVGAVTESTPAVTRPSNVSHLDFRSIRAALDKYIPVVREQGVDFVVVVLHEGAFCTEDGLCAGPVIEALSGMTATFDYAVTGHTHSRVETAVLGAPVVQSFSNSTAYSIGRLDRDTDGSVEARLLGIHQAWAEDVVPNSEVTAVVADFVEEANALGARLVTTIPEDLAAPRRGDFPLGRLIADGQRVAAGAQIALMNNGGIRRPLPKGSVTYAELFQLHPFGNEILRLEMTGAGLLASLEMSIANGETDLHASGITVQYDPADESGSRIRSVQLDDGSQVDPEATYVVAVNDFIGTGGGGYWMFPESRTSERTGVTSLQALVDYLEAMGPALEIPSDARWISVTREQPF